MHIPPALNAKTQPTPTMSKYASFVEKVQTKYDGKLKLRHWISHPFFSKMYKEDIALETAADAKNSLKAATRIKILEALFKLERETPRDRPVCGDEELVRHHLDLVVTRVLEPKLSGENEIHPSLREYIQRHLTVNLEAVKITNSLGKERGYLDKKSVVCFLLGDLPHYMISFLATKQPEVKVRLSDKDLKLEYTYGSKSIPQQMPWFQLAEIVSLAIGGSISAKSEGGVHTVLLSIPRTIETNGQLEFKV